MVKHENTITKGLQKCYLLTWVLSRKCPSFCFYSVLVPTGPRAHLMIFQCKYLSDDVHGGLGQSLINCLLNYLLNLLIHFFFVGIHSGNSVSCIFCLFVQAL